MLGRLRACPPGRFRTPAGSATARPDSRQTSDNQDDPQPLPTRLDSSRARPNSGPWTGLPIWSAVSCCGDISSSSFSKVPGRPLRTLPASADQRSHEPIKTDATSDVRSDRAMASMKVECPDFHLVDQTGENNRVIRYDGQRDDEYREALPIRSPMDLEPAQFRRMVAKPARPCHA